MENSEAMVYDEQGRLLRWQPEIPDATKFTAKCFSRQVWEEADQNKYFIKRLDTYHRQFYDNLEVSKRAIANWKKLRILIVLFKICGNKLHTDSTEMLDSKESKKFE